MQDDVFDRFVEILGLAATKALRDWADMMGVELTAGRVMLNGRSAATVMVVYETRRGDGTRKLLLKHDGLPGGKATMGEFARQREALETSGAFASHLAGLEHEPINVGDGTWITLQRFVDSPETPVLLTVVLRGLSGVQLVGLDSDDSSYADANTLARLCSTVERGILEEWARVPELKRVSVPEALRRHLGDRTHAGTALSELARPYSSPSMTVGGEELPNPFRLLQDDVSGPEVAYFPGPGHGDLHSENVLVTDNGGFWLIDLARYSPVAPLTQDPVQLLLSIVNRAGVAPGREEALVNLLAEPGPVEHAPELPGWLVRLAGELRRVGLGWAAAAGLSEEWREATRLSTLACALIFAARATTTPEVRTVFLRVAGRCAIPFTDGYAETGKVPDTVRPAATARGIDVLCDALPRLRAHPSTRSSVEDLVDRARAGTSVAEDVTALLGSIGVELSRGGELAGLMGRPVIGEKFTCPLNVPCGRVKRRSPGGRPPRCEYLGRDMTPLL